MLKQLNCPITVVARSNLQVALLALRAAFQYPKVIFGKRYIRAAMASWMLATSLHAQLLGPSPQHDIKEGAQVAKLVERQIGLCSLPVTEAYLNEVGQRLVAQANDPRWKFTFQIVDQEEPNSFAIAGGGIYVSRGLWVTMAG